MNVNEYFINLLNSIKNSKIIHTLKAEDKDISQINNHFNIKIFAIFIFTFFLIISNSFINEKPFFSKNEKIDFEKCYHSPDSKLKIIHLIFTRFMVEFSKTDRFIKNIYKESYIHNGIRVMKKYLITSLENQSCKQFIWIVMLGDKANLTYIKSLLNVETSFRKEIIYQNDYKDYVKNITKDIDILITTRIDYDDRIYYDAVNDVRKVININKPMLFYGYNRGVLFLEKENKYFPFWVTLNNEGVWGIFTSLITVLNKVNDSYTINEMGPHNIIRKKFLRTYKSFGIKELNYEPAIFDSGESKFVYVRQEYSRDYRLYINLKKNLIEYDFNLNKFYGK